MTVSIAHPGIHQIKPHMMGLPDGFSDSTIKLCSNESAFGPAPGVLAAASGALSSMQTYAEQGTGALQQVIADAYGLDKHRIVCGPGSDEVLARLCRVYLGPDSELIFSANGYAKFGNYALANDATPIKAPDNNLTVHVDSILELVTDHTRMVMVANPDNPTGTCIPGSEIRRLHQGLPAEVLLVVDSAYAEYVDDPLYEVPTDLVDNNDNVVMSRTFSKVHGLAGLRLGWLYGPDDVVSAINRIGLTFPISNIANACGIAAMQDSDYPKAVFRRNQALRNQLAADCKRLGLTTVPSQTNFVLVRFPATDKTAAAAEQWFWTNGVMVRRFPSPALQDAIRVTIGNESQMAQFTHLLEQFIQS